MPDVITADALLQKAVVLRDDAMTLLKKEDFNTDDHSEVERLMKEADAYAKRSNTLVALDQQKEQAINHFSRADEQEEPTRDDKKFDGFDSLGKYFQAVQNANQKNLPDPRLSYMSGEDGTKIVPLTDVKALAENVGASGGFLVPAEFDARVRAAQQLASIARPRAEIIRMTRRTVTIPVLDQTGATAGTANWFGGMVANWTEEAATNTESEPTWKQKVLTAHALTIYTQVSDYLIDDSAISLEDFLMGDKGFPGVITWEEDFAFVQGDGVGKPEGVLNTGAMLTQNRATANDITYEDIAGMLGQMIPGGRPVWVAHQSTMAELLTMNGPSGNPSYLWGNAESGIPNVLLGFPIIFTDKNPVLGTAGDLMLLDWSYYLIGDRQQTTIDMSKEVRFRFNEVGWKATTRVDGQPWLSAAITYEDGSTQVSPFVKLGDVAT